MPFQREVGALISPYGEVLKIAYGQPGMVNFPIQLAWRLHKANPGIVYCLMHTHPPAFTSLSGEDKTTLKAWAMAFSPFPIRMGIITPKFTVTAEEIAEEQIFEPYIIRIFYGDLESAEEWVTRGKQGSRRFRILEEQIDMSEWQSRYKWIDQLWALSCEENNVQVE